MVLLVMLRLGLSIDNIYLWFESYLHGRRQAIKFDGCLSAWGSVSVGVPQGSILVLFLSMICHLWYTMHGLTCMLMTLNYIVVVLIYKLFKTISNLTFTELLQANRLQVIFPSL